MCESDRVCVWPECRSRTVYLRDREDARYVSRRDRDRPTDHRQIHGGSVLIGRMSVLPSFCINQNLFHGHRIDTDQPRVNIVCLFLKIMSSLLFERMILCLKYLKVTIHLHCNKHSAITCSQNIVSVFLVSNHCIYILYWKYLVFIHIKNYKNTYVQAQFV